MSDQEAKVYVDAVVEWLYHHGKIAENVYGHISVDDIDAMSVEVIKASE